MPLSARLPLLRRFLLRRSVDMSGMSGVGIVAVGVQFPSGTCVLEWPPPAASVGIYASAAAMLEVHGHNGATVLEWIDADA